jgi:acetate---CoA ligase (ADP-forming)
LLAASRVVGVAVSALVQPGGSRWATQAAEFYRLACRAEGPGARSFLRASVNVQTGNMDADEGRAAEAAEPGRRDVTAANGAAGSEETEETLFVQEQIRDGVEMIIGVTQDPAFGPLALAGLGGTAVEVPGDVAARITPLSDTDIDEMLHSLRSYWLLTGYRQSPALDVAAFAELLHRVSAMVEDIPEIAELDLNPVFVRQHSAVVADVRVRLTG